MSIAPTLCPRCLAESRIATANGPTCPHQTFHGADWFPPSWLTMGEAGRLVWIERQNTKVSHGA